MAKKKSVYVCSDCGGEHSNWQGECKDCGSWNTLSEFVVSPSSSSKRPDPLADGRSGYSRGRSQVQALEEINIEQIARLGSGIGELDRVLGGGLVPGSAILIGGQPGAGKSTLLLQTLAHLAAKNTVLYVTGEESLQQIALRAQRLDIRAPKLKMLAETDVTAIAPAVHKLSPQVVVLDSIQVMHLPELQSAPGSVSQVREAAAYMLRLAKQTDTILLIVGHVTKDGTLAGPKVLEHMIDCSIMLEGGSDSRFRTLRSIKNRFGAVNELGVFGMTAQGLKEVKNPSAIFLNRGVEQSSGSVVNVVWEGTRPLMVEIQALVDTSQMSHPRRVAVGTDQNRLAMLLAVLHHHGGLQVGDQDVFINVVGGVKVMETAADLALLCAVVSSFRDQILPRDLVIFGEVGLTGEIRPVNSGQERIAEALKHGFKKAIIPHANMPKTNIKDTEVIGVSKLSEALEAL